MFSFGIIGGGLMGTAITATHLKNGCRVLLCEQSDAVLAALPQKIAAELTLQGEVNTRKLVREQLVLTQKVNDLVSCEIVMESIPEKIRLKQKLYQTLENLGFRGLLFSNTSTIEVSKLSEHYSAKDRFCGFHFFHPVRNRSLLEIVRGQSTSEETIRTAQEHARRLDKTPLVVEDRPGFLVNRLLNPMLREALAMLDEGIPLRKIEEAAVRFGMPMGPIRIMDEIGLDVTLHAGWVLNKAFPDRAYHSPTLLKLIDQGRLGRKTALGFLRYPSEISWEQEGEYDETLVQFLPAENDRLTGELITERLFLPMFYEAVRAVEEGVVKDWREVDLAVVLGLGFPKSCGGLFAWAKSLGFSNIDFRTEAQS
ncbi:MAG: 3-hydroxyacyl-CoA dehydrogenase [Planctomycetaceae bacterium]|nr:3-hydroxyacyl-CoA dehydrogenase [Planctomycetaceae bacterium]